MNFKDFVSARNEYNSSDTEAKFPPGYEGPGINILWMYPDILHMHGGKGNLMALARYGMLMKVPITIRKCRGLNDPVDLDWADIIIFESGDFVVMEDVIKALKPYDKGFKEFAERGKIIIAIGSTGTILAKTTEKLNGEIINGLSLLDMTMKERSAIFGDDLWIKTNDLELIGTEIQRVDTILEANQEPFGQTVYGRGNNDSVNKDEGARTNNVFFTNCLGPVFARNPHFAEYILTLAQEVSKTEKEIIGVPLADEDIKLELDALEDMKTFIKSKMDNRE